MSARAARRSHQEFSVDQLGYSCAVGGPQCLVAGRGRIASDLATWPDRNGALAGALATGMVFSPLVDHIARCRNRLWSLDSRLLARHLSLLYSCTCAYIYVKMSSRVHACIYVDTCTRAFSHVRVHMAVGMHARLYT